MEIFDDVLATFPERQSHTLRGVVHTLCELLPTATHDLTWGMPTFRCEGIVMVSVFGFTNHNSLFPGPGAIALMAGSLEGYTVTKGTIHFDKEKAPPKNFLRYLIAARVVAVNKTYPKKTGEFIDLYNNGVLKAKGKFRDDRMHGPWRFYRKDGTLMRHGGFHEGERTGEWVTCDRQGHAYKTTVFS